MKRVIEPRLSGLLLWAALQACTSEALVGDNRLVDREPADAAAPSIQGAIDDEAGPIKFDIEVERTVSPTWRHDFDCGGELCARAGDVRVAPDGSVWAVLQGGLLSVAPGMRGPVDTDELVFTQLAASDGHELAQYKRALVPSPTKAVTEYTSPLLIDQKGRPYVVRWPGFANNPPLPPGHVFRVADGKLEEQQLPTGFAKLDTRFIAGFPDGSFMEHSIQNETRAVRFSAAGERLWATRDLRAVATNSASGLANDGPTYLSDGSVVIDGLTKSGETGLSGAGLTVLGPDGQLRWDMTYWLSAWPYQKLAAGIAGELIVAGVRAPDHDLELFAYDARGQLLRSYRGVRTGYHAVGPRGLGVDENGAIYVAITVGDRKRPKLAVCKLESEAVLSAHCMALDLVAAERSENAIVQPFLYIRMEVAAPDVVLLALAHMAGEDVVTSIVRMDLAAPAAAAR